MRPTSQPSEREEQKHDHDLGQVHPRQACDQVHLIDLCCSVRHALMHLDQQPENTRYQARRPTPPVQNNGHRVSVDSITLDRRTLTAPLRRSPPHGRPCYGRLDVFASPMISTTSPISPMPEGSTATATTAHPTAVTQRAFVVLARVA